MVKRIIVITLPERSTPLMMADVHKRVSDRLGEDYIVFILAGIQNQPVSFQLFTDEKIEPIELDELKSLLNIAP